MFLRRNQQLKLFSMATVYNYQANPLGQHQMPLVYGQGEKHK